MYNTSYPLENVITSWMMTPYKFRLSSIGRPNEGYVPCEQCLSYRWVEFARPTRFCSHTCYSMWREGKFSGVYAPNYCGAVISYECKQCHNIFRDYRSRNRTFCSRLCSDKWNAEHSIGTNNHFYDKKHTDEVKCIISDGQTGDKNYWRSSGKVNSAAITAMTEKRAAHRSEEERIKISCTLRGIAVEEFDGFVSDERKQFMASIEYVTWRKSVFARDEYTCQNCAQSGGDLNAHHILPYKDCKGTSQALDIDNGITLCEKCHNITKGDEYVFAERFQSMIQDKYNPGKQAEFLARKRFEVG